MQENVTLPEGTRVAVVDDDDSMREAVKTLIGSMGLSVADFSSAEDFLSRIKSQVFDCLILDVRMPGMSGLELQRRLATGNNGIPTVFVTAHYRVEERARAIDAGAVDFLTKPFTEQELVDAIARCLGTLGRS